MSDINNVRPNFFPNSRSAQDQRIRKSDGNTGIQRNDQAKAKEIAQKSQGHAKVNINEGVKDFATIKKAVDSAPEIDREAKLAELKARINSGDYQIDYDGLADKIIEHGG